MLQHVIRPHILSRVIVNTGARRSGGVRFSSLNVLRASLPGSPKTFLALGGTSVGCSVALMVATGYRSREAQCEEVSVSSPLSDVSEMLESAISACQRQLRAIEGFFNVEGYLKLLQQVPDSKNLHVGEKQICHMDATARVKVELEAELVESLPMMSLNEVKQKNGKLVDGIEQLYVTFDGIVYDVTSFAEHHPGGKDLLKTAAGLDLAHFFENYTVHAQTDKAANWLAPLAVGKLSDEDAARARSATTPETHVEKRMQMLWRARRRMLLVVGTLPAWIAVRRIVQLIGWAVPPLGRFLARCLPVTVQGFSKGAEKLPHGKGKVAVIGGGIAGCGAAWALIQSGYEVTVYEARKTTSGNAKTWDWDGFANGETVKSCVSVTAWPPLLYKNYTCLLAKLGIETTPMPLSWFLNSKVPGHEGFLWGADPRPVEGSLRNHFAKDFYRYSCANWVVQKATDFFCLSWAPWKWGDTKSMYVNHTGLGMLNPFNVYPLYDLCRLLGVSEAWWDIVFTPYYTASFLVDELRPFPAVFGPIIEEQIPLIPHAGNSWQGESGKSSEDCKLTTCHTWKDAGNGLRTAFKKLTEKCDLKTDTRVREVTVLSSGKKRVYDEFDQFIDVDRVVFACPCNAIGNILKKHGSLENTIFSTPVYADDHHPSSGHMHAVVHSDSKVISPEFRKEVLTRGSNYVEVTKLQDGSINIENQYNFGVQTPGPGVYDMNLDEKPVMLISHSLGEGKSIDPSLVRGGGNHARAHPLYSGWNVMAQLSLRLVQGRDGCYYCSNWTTPGNCHDMSLLSGFICAHAIGADYPFPEEPEAKKDFNRMRDLMGI